MTQKREKWRDTSFSEKIKRIVFNFEDTFFEFTNRCEFNGLVKKENLITDNKSSLEHATAYLSVWCRNLRELIEEAKKTEYFFVNFIDIGSGKGKACFYADLKYNFKKIIGIEFSGPLIDIAKLNNKKI